MLSDHLPETKNKQNKCQTSSLKTGRVHLRNFSSGCLWESPWNSIWLRNKTVIYKVVAMRELTVQTLGFKIGFAENLLIRFSL